MRGGPRSLRALHAPPERSGRGRLRTAFGGTSGGGWAGASPRCSRRPGAMTHPRANRSVNSFAPIGGGGRAAARGVCWGSEHKPPSGLPRARAAVGTPSVGASSVPGEQWPSSARAPRSPPTDTIRRGKERAPPCFQRGLRALERPPPAGDFPGPWDPEPPAHKVDSWKGQGVSRAPLRVSGATRSCLPKTVLVSRATRFAASSVEQHGAASPSRAALRPDPLASGAVNPRAERGQAGLDSSISPDLAPLSPLSPVRQRAPTLP